MDSDDKPDRSLLLTGKDTWNAVTDDSGRAYERRQLPSKRRRRLPVLLFVATCLSTWSVGGPVYAACLMSLLLAHEMGHYLQARRYHVPASLPYFLPMPFGLLGTLGAVIVQGAGQADRRAMFDIAVSGPLAGLLLAIPMCWVGILNSEVIVIPPDSGGIIFGDPLVLKWMIHAVHGPLPDGADVLIGPVALAGWVGVLITALNLLPIGQLDGGHILYTLIGRRAHVVAITLLWSAVACMVVFRHPSPAYLPFAFLLLLIGPRHPPTANDNARLGNGRILLGWLTLAFLPIGFTPDPFQFTSERARPTPVADRPDVALTTIHRKTSPAEGTDDDLQRQISVYTAHASQRNCCTASSTVNVVSHSRSR